MSELLDKQMNAQKNLKKYFQGSRELPQAHEKVCDENENKVKNDERLKYFCWEEVVYKARAETSCNGYQMTSGQRFLIH